MLISVPFLVATSATYGCLEEVWRLRGRRHSGALAAHCGCLGLAFFSLAITQLASQHLPPVMCQIAGTFSLIPCVLHCDVLPSLINCVHWSTGMSSILSLIVFCCPMDSRHVLIFHSLCCAVSIGSKLRPSLFHFLCFFVSMRSHMYALLSLISCVFVIYWIIGTFPTPIPCVVFVSMGY